MLNKIKALISPKHKAVAAMMEKQPLPLGMQEFEVWSDRIIDQAMVNADRESQKFALSDMILHLNATEDHKEDGYFIKVLRKVAVNQIADAKRREIRDAVKARKEAEDAADAAQQDGDVKPTESVAPPDVLEKPGV